MQAPAKAFDEMATLTISSEPIVPAPILLASALELSEHTEA